MSLDFFSRNVFINISANFITDFQLKTSRNPQDVLVEKSIRTNFQYFDGWVPGEISKKILQKFENPAPDLRISEIKEEL